MEDKPKVSTDEADCTLCSSDDDDEDESSSSDKG